MPYCSNCGSQIEAGLKFCPVCGAPQGETAAPDQALQVQKALADPPATTAKGTKRPAAVALLALFDLIAGIFLLIIGLLGALTATAAATSSFGVFLAILGVYSIVVARGYSRAEAWIWWPGLAQGGIVLALGVLITISGIYLYGVLALLLGGWTIYQLTRGKARSFLGRG